MQTVENVRRCEASPSLPFSSIPFLHPFPHSYPLPLPLFPLLSRPAAKGLRERLSFPTESEQTQIAKHLVHYVLLQF